MVQDCFLCDRREKLEASYQLQKFNSVMKEFLDWIQEVKGRMEAGRLPKSLGEADSMIEEHQERRASINYIHRMMALLNLE